MELLTRKKQASIDLLNDEQKVKSNSQKKFIVSLSVIITLLVVVISGAIFLYSFSQKLRLDKLKEDIAAKTQEWQTLESVGTDIKKITGKNQVITQSQAKYSGLDKRIDKLRESLPEGLSLTTLTIDNQGKTFLAGKASQPDIVYQFQELLKKDSNFLNPTIDSLAKATTEYTFNISLTINIK